MTIEQFAIVGLSILLILTNMRFRGHVRYTDVTTASGAPAEPNGAWTLPTVNEVIKMIDRTPDKHPRISRTVAALLDYLDVSFVEGHHISVPDQIIGKLPKGRRK